MVRMRITLDIDEVRLRKAAELTGIEDTDALVHMGLERLIARESGKRLAALGGSEPNLAPIPRRRPSV